MTRRRAQRGLTLLEVLVAALVLVMVATMIWAAFDQTGRMRTMLASRQENDHLARVALSRITRDLRGSFISLHVNQTQTLVAIATQFKASTFGGGSQVDMATFTHRRLRRGTHEGDACEVGYRLADRRGAGGGYDLLRRESPRLDGDPLRGGTIDVLVPNVSRFELKFFDEAADAWTDTWDTSQGTGQLGRLPIRVRVTLAMREGEDRIERVYSVETPVIMTRPLTFGLPIY